MCAYRSLSRQLGEKEREYRPLHSPAFPTRYAPLHNTARSRLPITRHTNERTSRPVLALARRRAVQREAAAAAALEVFAFLRRQTCERQVCGYHAYNTMIPIHPSIGPTKTWQRGLGTT